MALTGTKAKTNVLLLNPIPRPLVIRPIPSETPGSFDTDRPASPTRLWDLHSSLHCSIIGTCLTTAELRQILRKAGLPRIETFTDHDLHSIAVGFCSKQQIASKLLHKALDRKHRGAIKRFDGATKKDEIQALWRDSLEKGDIPGAYWAVLTHALAGEELVRNAFGDVHMLSHLVGAANRADIRRLCQLEAENTALHEKVYRQQVRLRDVIIERDETIRGLKAALADALTSPAPDAKEEAGGRNVDGKAAGIIADFNHKLKRQTAQTARLESRLEAMSRELALSKKECTEWQRRSLELQTELEAVDECLSTDEQRTAAKNDLNGKMLLYVGGRSNHVPQLKRLAEDCGAGFLHHDGGLEDNSHSLAALVARADAILFPVDCISHGAVTTLKRVCRQLNNKYFPLRSSGLTSFAGFIQRLDLSADYESRSERVQV